MRQHREEYFTRDILSYWLDQGESPMKNDGPAKAAMWKQLTKYAKKNPKKGLHISEMRWPTVPLDEWLKLATEGDPEGMLPCDVGHKYDPRPPEEFKKMEA